jgi:lipoate---protein ligase
MSIRFIDAGTVTGLRSQSIYHGLGYAQTPATPDTIVLVTPGTPYMCIGFFQDLANELDINYCRTKQLPVIRRETGGGAVYIDDGQLFVQWIFQQSSLPRRVDQRFQLFIKPLIETYKFFGINAYYHPINDVHVGGKKIVGTGAGTIGEGEVVTGNFLFNFNYETMIQAINVPGDDFRAAVRKNLKAYLTTMHLEMEQLPGRDEVIKVYREKCEDELGLKTEIGEFTDAELRQMEIIEDKFVKDDWLYQISRKPSKDKLFKVHLGVWIGQIHHQTNHGVMQALTIMKDNHLQETKLAYEGSEIGDYSLPDIETVLSGVLMDRELLKKKIAALVDDHHLQDWVECIYKIKELQMQQTGNGAVARHN